MAKRHFIMYLALVLAIASWVGVDLIEHREQQVFRTQAYQFRDDQRAFRDKVNTFIEKIEKGRGDE